VSDLAIVLVHYRTPGLLVEAVGALQRDLASSRLDAEILVVDNGSEPADRKGWSGLEVRRIDPGANLGYAGGVRCGVEASRAPQIVAMNPDVLVAEGCLGRLCAELERGAAAAGPQFFWDRERRFHLPPTEPRSATAELRAALARRYPASPLLAAGARRAWRRHARRHWEAAKAFASPALSGALIAFRRDAWVRVGPFDEAFRLYFEETDWLLRLRAAGLESRFVPTAHAVHLFAQSSVQEPRAAGWFADAERLFRRRYLGAAITRVLEALGTAPPPGEAAPAPAPPVSGGAAPAFPLATLATPRPPVWIEVALAAGGFPAAGERLRADTAATGEWRMPEEIWRRLPPGELWLRGVDAGGRESSPLHLRRGASSAAEGPA